MAITKTSGAIAMSEIQTEFGGSNPISMSEYYGDGSYVSDGAADGDGNAIPESGAISISHFYDTSDCVSFTTAQFRTKGSAIGNMTLAGGLAAAFNNSTSGDWQSGARKDPSDDAYIGRNFNEPVNIGQIKVYNPAGGGGSNVLPGDGMSDGGGAYYAQWSTDGNTWTTVASGTNPAADSLTITFTGVLKQYWRVFWTGNDDGGTVQEMEFTSSC